MKGKDKLHAELYEKKVMARYLTNLVLQRGDPINRGNGFFNDALDSAAGAVQFDKEPHGCYQLKFCPTTPDKVV